MNTLTYLSIGSCPHAITIADLNEKSDQMVPKFLRSHILNGECVNVILIDPMFAEPSRVELMKSYFKRIESELSLELQVCFEFGLNIVTGKTCNYYSGICKNFCLKVFCDTFDYHHLHHLDIFIHHVLESEKSKLIIQQFSGEESLRFAQSLFESSRNKSDFCNRILIDMTFGECSCSTDMSTTCPIYTSTGNFFNFLLYSDEYLRSINFQSLPQNGKRYVIKYFKKIYKERLNRRHVDFRRTLRKEDCLFEENKFLDCESIFGLLEKELLVNAGILRKLGVFDDLKIDMLRKLFETHKEYDVYKWYSAVDSLVA